MSIVRRMFRVSGRVQGVFFRASTRDKAVSLKLVGHAHNLSDGSVEVFVSGRADAVEELHRWLHRGPPLANVSGVEEIAADYPEAARFTID